MDRRLRPGRRGVLHDPQAQATAGGGTPDGGQLRAAAAERSGRALQRRAASRPRPLPQGPGRGPPAKHGGDARGHRPGHDADGRRFRRRRSPRRRPNRTSCSTSASPLRRPRSRCPPRRPSRQPERRTEPTAPAGARDRRRRTRPRWSASPRPTSRALSAVGAGAATSRCSSPGGSPCYRSGLAYYAGHGRLYAGGDRRPSPPCRG